MKKALILFLAITTLISCKEKDIEKNENSIVGKWYMYSFGDDEEINHGKCSKDYFEFTENGILKYMDYYEKNGECKEDLEEGTYSINGTKLISKFPKETEKGEFSIDNNIMKWNIWGGEMILERL